MILLFFSYCFFLACFLSFLCVCVDEEFYYFRLLGISVTCKKSELFLFCFLFCVDEKGVFLFITSLTRKESELFLFCFIFCVDVWMKKFIFFRLLYRSPARKANFFFLAFFFVWMKKFTFSL